MTSTRRTIGLLAATLLAATVPTAAHRAPAPAATPLSGEVPALACGSRVVFERPATPLRITGGQDGFARRVYLPGDLVTINAGTMNGIEVGQEFFVRRLQVSRREAVTRDTPGSVRTTGWIKVWAVDDEMSLATVTHACDTIEVEDYLEPLVLPTVVDGSTTRGKPERDNYGRVMVGSDLRRVFAKGDFVIVNRGSQDGVTPGAQFVFYRDQKRPENFLYNLGEAYAVEVSPETSTLRVTVSRDSIVEGDYVAMRR